MKVWEEWQKRALVAERENERIRAALSVFANEDNWSDQYRFRIDRPYEIAQEALDAK